MHRGVPDLLRPLSIIYTTIIAISAALLVLLAFVKWKQSGGALRTLVVVVISAAILNCADFAALSVVVGRYGAKMIWMLPFCALLWLVEIKKTHAHAI